MKLVEQYRRQIQVALILSIIVKISWYYKLMEVEHNTIMIIGITSIYLLSLFLFFKEKIIPAVLYLIFSILMFLEATYYSYFHRNISVQLLRVMGTLSDVSSSVSEVIRFKFILLILDAIIILALAIISRVNQSKSTRYYKNKYKYSKNIYYSNRPKYIVLKYVLVAFILFMTFMPIKIDPLAFIPHQEFVVFHFKDIVNRGMESYAFEYNGQFESAKLDYEQNINGKYFGVGNGKNLIVIQCEALQDFVINEGYDGKMITPNLNRLIKDGGIYFENYYQQIGVGNTSDAEFVTNNSLYPSLEAYTYGLYDENYFYGLPMILKDKGYETAAFHGYKKDFWNRENAYKAIGFNHFYGEPDFNLDDILGMGISDMSFLRQSSDYIERLHKPFYSFIVTLSCHHPYEVPDTSEFVLGDPEEESLFERYLQGVHYTDYAIGEFIEGLKANGLYENSVIAIYGDHFGLNIKDDDVATEVSEFLGYEYNYDEMMNIPLIIHIPNSNINEKIETVGGQIDFLPTISYIMGIKKIDSLFLGKNLIHEDKGFVAEQTFLPKGSFISDGIMFQFSKDGVFNNSKAWDIKTKNEVDVANYEELSKKAINDIHMSQYVLKNDILRKVLQEGYTTYKAFK